MTKLQKLKATSNDLVKNCNCGCMYKEDECPNCNKVTDSDRIAESEDNLKIAEDDVKHLKAEVKYLRLRVRELDSELDSERG